MELLKHIPAFVVFICLCWRFRLGTGVHFKALVALAARAFALLEKTAGLFGLAVVLLLALFFGRLLEFMLHQWNAADIVTQLLFATVTFVSVVNYHKTLRTLRTAAVKEMTRGLFALHFVFLIAAFCTLPYPAVHLYILWGIYGGYCYQNHEQLTTGDFKESLIGCSILLQENAPSFSAYAVLWMFSLLAVGHILTRFHISLEFLQGAALFHLSVSAFRYFIVIQSKVDPLDVALDNLPDDRHAKVIQKAGNPFGIRSWSEFVGCAYVAAAPAWCFDLMLRFVGYH